MLLSWRFANNKPSRFVFWLLWDRGDFWTYNCFQARVNVQPPTVFQRTGFQRTGRSRLSIWRSPLFRSIGNAMAFSAIPIYWDWAFPMNGFWISPNTRDFWLNGLRRKSILKNDLPQIFSGKLGRPQFSRKLLLCMPFLYAFIWALVVGAGCRNVNATFQFLCRENT